MMEPEEARIVLRWVRHYATLGRIAPPDLKAIEGDCLAAMERPAAAEPDREGVTLSQVLHVLGGMLLAAAAIAAVILLISDGTLHADAIRSWALAGLGAAAAAIGFTLFYATKNQDLADAFLVAALVCLGLMSFPDKGAAAWLGPIGAVACLAIPIARRSGMVAAIASFAFTAAVFRTMDTFYGTSGFIFDNVTDTGVTLFLVVIAMHLAATFAGARMGHRWLSPSLGVDAVAVVLPLAWFVGQVLQPSGHNSLFFTKYGGSEILVAIPELLLVALALATRQSSLLVGAALVVSVDAIVFAFDVGGLQFGVVSLLVVAGAVLGLGTYLRKRWSRPASPTKPL